MPDVTAEDKADQKNEDCNYGVKHDNNINIENLYHIVEGLSSCIWHTSGK